MTGDLIFRTWQISCMEKIFFSRIDLIRAYHHIPVAKNDIHRTAITTSFGMFEFSRVMFELRNTTQTFQRFMNEVLNGQDFVKCYIDDVLIISISKDEHEIHLKVLFERLSEYDIKLNVSKCLFGVESFDFLGHTINSKGIE